MTPSPRSEETLEFQLFNEDEEMEKKMTKEEKEDKKNVSFEDSKVSDKSREVIKPNIEELKEYRKFVEKYATEKDPLLFPNSNCYHAAIVLSKIVEHADKSVRIYDDGLSGDLSGKYDEFNEFNDILKNFIDRVNQKEDAKLQIVVRDNVITDSKIYSLLKKYNNNKVEVKEVSTEFKNKIIEVFGIDYNFAVGDDKAFRLEEYDENKDVRKAICSFNRTDYANDINKIFDMEFDSCKSIF